MNFDVERLRQFAPAAAPIVLIGLAWVLLIGPASATTARDGRQLEGLRQRVQTLHLAVSQPAPPVFTTTAGATFEREVAAGDGTSMLLERLARLASEQAVRNLLIETGERVVVSAPGSGPQVAGTPVVDPRVALFDTKLSYSPVTMSFDADYAAIGALLWHLRDLPTIVEIRSLDLKARVGSSPDDVVTDAPVHVSLTLFAYARERTDAVVLQAVNARGRR